MSNSEKYLVCKGFKYDQKKDSSFLDKKIGSLENILENMSGNEYVQDIFPNLELPYKFVDMIRYINIICSFNKGRKVYLFGFITWVIGNMQI